MYITFTEKCDYLTIAVVYKKRSSIIHYVAFLTAELIHIEIYDWTEKNVKEDKKLHCVII